ncbi:50S ribosomal protein L19 [Candidatus Uhrbacteria bacterium CG10_big_fil_rev_8_21_14_0_10_50_16]|uniref:50S ribosomal protein L19 n=1 Tax=Candidatus Uhrbacteria bacterium CG10_big_fil_rev_8_21_14_0_10_50_16 TaxID=1975039 RepID=A0A2H0RLL5_9BACT|nr:MAG: 50S ribosomal protein L19 [Candidatus Uhrbacteria bacterium CG10_big_fil_rev_8_21_14_0_10_50_16]
MPHRDLKPGMVIRVHEIIKDTNAKGEERQRVQVFEGTLLGLNGSGITRTMTVRKVTGEIGVEKIYPLSSPHVEKVEIVKTLRVRRAKLWFLRKGKTKRRMKEVK